MKFDIKSDRRIVQCLPINNTTVPFGKRAPHTRQVSMFKSLNAFSYLITKKMELTVQLKSVPSFERMYNNTGT
ncbi:Hypothetical predicted protein [Octopus vulgaris]|uniref:Uncharacterized protein n=1 Tax=Octopus vulgaris TaxID=6645 RepID=A0AA36F9P1_OCTVU|nr:Hypothetical predicted protein [Octopus vulgaris]